MPRPDAPRPRARRPAPGASRRGFTLLEVLFATIVLGVAIVGIAQGFSAGIRANSIAHATSIATELARTKLSEYDSGVTPVTQNDEGDFDAYGYPEYRYRVDSRSTQWAGLYELVLTVEWPERGETRNFVVVQWMLDRQAGALAGLQSSGSASSTKTGTSSGGTKKK
jgi:prepilin-type N-terminal cleavage/methylation domain-containing protein